MIASTQNVSSVMTVSQNSHITMSSREIGELLQSRHDKVKQSIERLAARGVIKLPPLGEATYFQTSGRRQRTTEYRISERDSYVIVAQLSPEFTARLVDRWHELEKRARHPQPVIPQSYGAALRLAADLADERTRLVAIAAEYAPKEQALERIASAEGSACISNTAKALKIRPTELFSWLNNNNWIFRHPDGGPWRAYQAKIDRGFLEVKIGLTSNGKAFAQVLITPKGLTRLAVLLPQPNGMHLANESSCREATT